MSQTEAERVTPQLAGRLLMWSKPKLWDSIAEVILYLNWDTTEASASFYTSGDSHALTIVLDSDDLGKAKSIADFFFAMSVDADGDGHLWFPCCMVGITIRELELRVRKGGET